MEIEKIAKIVNGKIINKVENHQIKNFAIDSRQIEKGDFFVPLKGNRFDGHQFIKDAVEKGAAGYFTENFTSYPNGIFVKNTLKALTDIGKYKREKLSLAIGITGTSGKTTTKEILNFLLSEKYRTYATKGNYNNEIGVPLTLSNITENSQIGIFEMGASKIGDIKYLVSIVKPDIRILTSVGYGHTEGFGSFESVIRGKGEIFENGKNFILPFPLLKYYKLKNPVTFGFEEEADIKISNIKITEEGTEGNIQIQKDKIHIKVPVFNRSIFLNIAAASGVLKILGMDFNILKKLQDYTPLKGRGNIVRYKNITIIDDTYNANPLSVENAIKTLSEIPSKRIIVLGDMLELGREEERLHREIGRKIANSNIDIAIFYGERMKYAFEEVKNKKESYYFESKKEIANKIINISKKQKTTALVKGSRGMKMEEVIQHILDS